MEQITKQELVEAAGNLRAELISVRDDWRRGQIDTGQYLARVRVIRGRGQKFKGDYYRVQAGPVQQTLIGIQEHWTALVGAADSLKFQTERR